jgi:hypothetical protein
VQQTVITAQPPRASVSIETRMLTALSAVFLLVFLRGHVAETHCESRMPRAWCVSYVVSATARCTLPRSLVCVAFVTSARLCAGAAALRGMIDDPSSIQQLLADPHLGPLLGSLLTRGT